MNRAWFVWPAVGSASSVGVNDCEHGVCHRSHPAPRSERVATPRTDVGTIA